MHFLLWDHLLGPLPKATLQKHFEAAGVGAVVV